MKKIPKSLLTACILGTLLTVGFSIGTANAESTTPTTNSELITQGIQEEALKLSQEWDKVFPKSEKVTHKKVIFHNRYGITLAADMYIPKNIQQGEKLPAITISGPFGAVKEQVSGLYAQTLAERGYITLAFDPSFTGESGGNVRNVASPDINTEDYSAAIDFLTTQENVDSNRLGILGVCGFGSIALNNASMDTRVKATVSSTMYDMTRFFANNYNDSENNPEIRQGKLEALNQQRTVDYKNNTFDRTGANLKPEQLTESTPQFVKEYTYYYETERGFHPRSVNSVGGWNKTSALSFINLPFLQRSNEIQNAVLIIAGENAHSRYFSEDSFKYLTGNNKELYIVPNAVHTDLYDQLDKIPFDKIDTFYKQYLK